MKPVVIIEGADGTGKTVLARLFARSHGFAPVHCGPPDGPALRYYLEKLYGSPEFTVADRFHGGSYVYGRVFRSGDDLSEFERWVLEGYLWARGCVVILASLPRTVVDANLCGRVETEYSRLYEDPSCRDRVAAEFNRWAELTTLPLARYDYSAVDGTTELALHIVTGTVAWARIREEKKTVRVPALGNTVDPSVVFVSDASSRITRVERQLAGQDADPATTDRLWRRLYDRHRYDPPFTGGPSARFFKRALDVTGLGRDGYCIINSKTWDGRSSVDLAAALTGCRAKLVAVGRRAAERLDAAGIEYRAVPHPQFVRRFFYRRTERYAELLTGEREYDRTEWITGGAEE